MRTCLIALFAALVGTSTATAADAPTFYKDVLPILQKNCQSCHRPGEVAPMSLVTYEQTRPWARAIKVAIASKKMPPWFADPAYGHFSNERRLSAAEIDAITAWVDAGAPAGKESDAPAPLTFETGWNIKPDVVVEMPKPFALPASGTVNYKYILVKTNFAEVLRRELGRPSWAREYVACGTATDPYQPIEGRYRLTRQSIEALTQARTPVGIVTKGPMVVRDTDVLGELGRAARCSVYMSVPTVDEDAWRLLEPGTAHPLQRLRAVRDLVDAGIDAGVLMAPIVPGLSSSRAKLERTVKAIADHGARFVGCNVMHLQDGTRRHFMKFIEQAFPSMRPRFERLYAHKYAPDAYRREIKAMVGVLQRRYGLQTPEHRGPGGQRERSEPERQLDPEQVGFAW